MLSADLVVYLSKAFYVLSVLVQFLSCFRMHRVDNEVIVNVISIAVRWRIATRSACHSKAVKWVAEEFLIAPLCRDARDGKNGSFTDTVFCVLYGTSVTFVSRRKVPCLDIPLSVAPSACKKDIVFFQCVPPFVHYLFECFC